MATTAMSRPRFEASAAAQRPRASAGTTPCLPSQSAALCSALLEATRASALHLPDARDQAREADVAARTYVLSAPLAANLIIARVAEAQGDLAPGAAGGAPAGKRHLASSPYYLSTFLREEGRLAALTGDTAGAIRAYQHYLALRPDPEPAVKPEVDRVRGELAHLVGEHPKKQYQNLSALCTLPRVVGDQGW